MSESSANPKLSGFHGGISPLSRLGPSDWLVTAGAFIVTDPVQR